jgi:hypothetical protein
VLTDFILNKPYCGYFQTTLCPTGHGHLMGK